LTRALSRLSALRAQLGAADSALYVLSRLLERVTRGRARLVKYYLVAQPVRPGPALRPDAKTVLRHVKAGDPLTASFPRPTAVIDKRYRDGAHCLAAEVNGSFAGYIWWQHGRYEEDEVRCTYLLPDPALVWDYDVYVDEKLRLGRTMARLWHAVSEHLAGIGVRWSFSRISAFNPASLAAHRRLGAVTTGSLLFVAIGSRNMLLQAVGVVAERGRNGDTPRVTLKVPTAAVPALANGAEAHP
jgi:hypothetical protein